MTVSLKHAFTSGKSDGGDNTLVQPSNWNAEHTLTLANNTVLGRNAGTDGAAQELTGSDLRTLTGLATTDSPQFTAINVGHASDTTIARVSAGVVSVEGSNVILASNKLSALSATTSAELAGVISDETGSGALVFATSPTFTTSSLHPAGSASAPSIAASGDTNTGVWFPAADIVSVATGGTERARFTSAGYLKASSGGTYISSTGEFHEFVAAGATVASWIRNTNAAPFGVVVEFSAASPDNNSAYFLRCDDSTTSRLYIYSDGDVINHDGTYGTISDVNLKQDIVDAPSQWADVKAFRFRKYRMKSDVAADPNAQPLLGVIAQEIELTSPGLVDEYEDDDGNKIKTVKSSILLTKAAVALQEAMARIEALEARIAALEA